MLVLLKTKERLLIKYLKESTNKYKNMKKNTIDLKQISSKRAEKVTEAISKKLKTDQEEGKEGLDLIGLAKELSGRNQKVSNEN